jgi:metal-responsive CopG/Arc/MetJ family transcriptional regulator
MRRISVIIPEELHSEILKVAQLDNRSLTYAVISLLQKGLKEKNRKHAKKEVHITHNTSN